MRTSRDRAQRMGEAPIPKLLLEFSLPVMTGMVVQAVYSVVNRMFIGNAPEAATLGLAAITIGMPIMLISMAFGGLIGFGGAAALSIYLGEQDRESSERALGNGFSLAVLIGLGVTLVGLVFLDPLLASLGATDEVFPYAREYNRIILLGSVPATVSFGMSNYIRAEGNPARSMRIMVSSAVCNAALDYLFILVLDWGVQGAALGTVLSQCFAAAQALAYYARRKSHVQFHLRNLVLDRGVALRTVALGSSAFFLHVGNSFVQFVLNNQLEHYGGDVALAAWGVIQSITLFFLFPIFGVNAVGAAFRSVCHRHTLERDIGGGRRHTQADRGGRAWRGVGTPYGMRTAGERRLLGDGCRPRSMRTRSWDGACRRSLATGGCKAA